MTNKTKRTVTISAEPITIPAAQFSRLLKAAVHCDYLMEQKRIGEEKIVRMRKELTRYQTLCENAKRTSGAGASKEPQATKTNAPGIETDAGLLAIETEGRVSDGERAELERRLAAAERCIEDIEAVMSDGVIADCAEGMKVNDIIRAWCEKREAK